MSAAKADKERLSDEWKSQTELCCRLRWSDNLLNCSRQSVSQLTDRGGGEEEETKNHLTRDTQHTDKRFFFLFLFFSDRLFSETHCLADGHKRAPRCLHICTIVFFLFIFFYSTTFMLPTWIFNLAKVTLWDAQGSTVKKSPINWRK